MKKTILFLSFVWFALATFAQSHILTVSNTPDQPAQYTDLQAAIDSAKPGDTIYVLGSRTSYGDITIDHDQDSITLIGVGFDPDNYNNISSKLGEVTLKGADYITIKGFYISHFVIGGYSDDYSSNIIIENNYIEGGEVYEYVGILYLTIYIPSYAFNIIIKGNVLNKRIYLGSSSDAEEDDDNVYGILISNNYLSYITQENHYVSYSAYNNIFTANGYGIEGYNGVVRNNIFYLNTSTDTLTWSHCSGCVYENNLFYNSNTSYPLSTSDTSITNHNLVNQDPQFVNYADPYSSDADYHLKSTSPGHNYGTDGTDIGIYGGGYNFIKTGEVAELPSIYHFSIDNNSVRQNDTLRVRIKAHSNL